MPEPTLVESKIMEYENKTINGNDVKNLLSGIKNNGINVTLYNSDGTYKSIGQTFDPNNNATIFAYLKGGNNKYHILISKGLNGRITYVRINRGEY